MRLDQLGQQLQHHLVRPPRGVERKVAGGGIPAQCLQRRGEGDFLPDRLADRVVDRQPAPFAAEVDLAAGRLDHPTAQCVGHAEVEVSDQAGNGGLVAVCLVSLQHGELGRVGGVDPLVAEDASHLIDPVDPADDGLLEVELERDPEGHSLVKGVEVRVERPGRGATVDGLQDRCLHLQEALVLQRSAHGGDAR